MDTLKNKHIKVLILAYDFPPYVSAGGLRPYSWKKYLIECNIYPVIVTRQWVDKGGNPCGYVSPGESNKVISKQTLNHTVIAAPYFPNLANKILLKFGEKKFKWLRKTISAFYEVLQFIRLSGPKASLYYAAREYIMANKTDAIVATGDPFVLFKYAQQLSKEFDIPWFADYRDIWANDYTLKKKILLREWYKRIEPQVIQSVSGVFFVSEFVREKTLRYIRSQTPTFIIPNGYDSDIVERAGDSAVDPAILSIGYAGSVLPWHPLEYFLSVVNEFISENPSINLNLNFYGTNVNDEIIQLTNNRYPKLSNVVRVYPKMSYKDVVFRLAENHLLLLFNYYSFMGTKIYDYIGIKRNILLCFTEDKCADILKEKHYTINDSAQISSHLQEDLINETMSGKVIRDGNHLKESLQDYYNELINKQKITCNSIGTEVYSRREKVMEFGRTIIDLISKKNIEISNNTILANTHTKSEKQKKVLILAFDFPPYISVGGLRPYSWLQHFQNNGIYPVVITRQWTNAHQSDLDFVSPGYSKHPVIEKTPTGTIIRTPYTPNLPNRMMLKYGDEKFRVIRKILSLYYEILQWVVITGPKSEIFRAAKRYLEENHVDVIIASGEPFILFKYASLLSKKTGVPWIADYRDPWSQNIKNSRNLFLGFWYRYFERKIVEKANAVVTVSAFVKNKISNLFPFKTFYIVPNGFDSLEIEKYIDVKPRSSELQIAFVGTINPWHPFVQFFKVFSRFIQDHTDRKIVFNLYGLHFKDRNQKDWFERTIKNSTFINTHPKLINADLIKELASNHLMLLFNDYSLMGTKIYDYIGIRRPILFCFSNDEEAKKLKNAHHYLRDDKKYSNNLQEELIRKTESGFVIKDQIELYAMLKRISDEFIIHGRIDCNTKQIDEYSRKHQARIYCDVIRNLTGE